MAGDANSSEWHSKMKFTLLANWMRSPLGIVSRRLSSSTELSDSIHSGSTSPSQTIQLRCSSGSLTTWDREREGGQWQAGKAPATQPRVTART